MDSPADIEEQSVESAEVTSPSSNHNGTFISEEKRSPANNDALVQEREHNDAQTNTDTGRDNIENISEQHLLNEQKIVHAEVEDGGHPWNGEERSGGVTETRPLEVGDGEVVHVKTDQEGVEVEVEKGDKGNLEPLHPMSEGDMASESLVYQNGEGYAPSLQIATLSVSVPPQLTTTSTDSPIHPLATSPPLAPPEVPPAINPDHPPVETQPIPTTTRSEPSNIPFSRNPLASNMTFAPSLLEPIVCDKSVLFCPISVLSSRKTLEEIFSVETWNEVLSEEDRKKLLPFLPPSETPQQVDTLLQDLLNLDSSFWGAPGKGIIKHPLEAFIENLLEGQYHPEVVQYKNCIQKLRQKGSYIDLQTQHFRALKQTARFKQQLGYTIEPDLAVFLCSTTQKFSSEKHKMALYEEEDSIHKIDKKRKRRDFVLQRFENNKKMYFSLMDKEILESEVDNSSHESDNYSSDDENHPGKKLKTNFKSLDQKSEHKKYTPSSSMVFALFSTIRDIFSENITTSIQPIVSAVNQFPPLLATIPPHYTVHTFLELALKYLAHPPRLPQQAAGSSDIFVAPFIEYLKDTQQWRWKAPPSPQMHYQLESLEQLFYFAVTRKKVNCDEKGRVQIPFHLIKQQKCRVTIPNSTEEQVELFHTQEKERFEHCERPYVFNIQGMKSIVAPLKKSSNPLLRAREHNLLVESRPSHINLLSLIRNAASRLPGGVGTRADVAHLMKDSQFVKPGSSDHKLNQAVSGALDRLQASPDPPVRYDQDQKLWIYLHRLRTEEDFLKLPDAPHNTEEAEGPEDM